MGYLQISQARTRALVGHRPCCHPRTPPGNTRISRVTPIPEILVGSLTQQADPDNARSVVCGLLALNYGRIYALTQCNESQTSVLNGTHTQTSKVQGWLDDGPAVRSICVRNRGCIHVQLREVSRGVD
jgi:hypothetical protein